MKYLGKPTGMWALFAGSFEKHLTVEFDLTAEQAKDVAARAKKKYREIIAKLPEFDKRDRFEMNIVNCAMLAAFIPVSYTHLEAGRRRCVPAYRL